MGRVVPVTRGLLPCTVDETVVGSAAQDPIQGTHTWDRSLQYSS